MLIESYKQVDLLYTLFLGRLPESNFAREDCLGRDVVEHARTAIASEEFRQSVLERFLQYGKLPHLGLSLRLLPEVLELVTESGLASPALGHSATTDWKTVLGRVLCDAPCRPVIEEIYGEEGRQLIERLTHPEMPLSERGQERPLEQPPAPARDIVSGVEIIANTICRGWLIEPAAPNTPLHVRVKLNGATAKVALADEFRRDVQDRYGGTGHAGFTIRLDRLPDIGHLSRATIEITELSRGVVILPAHVVEFSPARTLKIEAELHAELASVRGCLDRLQTMVPADAARRWKMPFVGPLRSDRAQAIAEDIAAIQEELGKASKSLSRLEQDFPQLINATTWPLAYYSTLQPQLPLVIRPPHVDDPARFSIVIVSDEGRRDATEATLASVLEQTLKPVEILLVLPSAAAWRLRRHDPVVSAIRSKPSQPLFEVVNQAAHTASGSHLLILDAGDILKPEMLAWLAHAIAQTAGAVIYTDGETVKVESGRRRVLPRFLPAFDYDLLLQSNYIGQVFCIAREAYRALGGFTVDPALDPRHDFLLRASVAAGRRGLFHLPQLLFSSVAPSTCTTSAQTVQHHLDRLAIEAQAVPHNDSVGRSLPAAARVVWSCTADKTISVIVPTRDRADLVFALVSSMRRHAAAWERVECIIIVNGDPNPPSRFAFSELEKTYPGIKLVFRPSEFNWGAINNTGVREQATGEIVVFLNDDMVCLTSGWDRRLAGQLNRPDVGVIGGRLLYPDGAVQHAGITFCGQGMTAHEAMGDLPDDGLYLDRTLLVHEVGAVTGAFLSCRRHFFEELGGFDAEHYTITSSDADFCVRARNAGKAVLYDPSLTWIHFESITRGSDSGDYKKHWRAEQEHENWRRKFSEIELVDLSINPHLTGSTPPFHAFHRVTQAGIGMWLEAQLKRGVVVGRHTRTAVGT